MSVTLIITIIGPEPGTEWMNDSLGASLNLLDSRQFNCRMNASINIPKKDGIYFKPIIIRYIFWDMAAPRFKLKTDQSLSFTPEPVVSKYSESVVS